MNFNHSNQCLIAGKAARDAYFRSVALERPEVRVLNYAPGPVDTAMADTLKSSSYLQEFYANESNILTTEQTVAKLIKIFTRNTFVNGAHVDYYDTD